MCVLEWGYLIRALTLFENLVRSNIVWGNIEKLFVGLETTILEGTRVRGSVFS